MSIHNPDPFEDITSLPVADRGPWLATSTGGMWSIQHPSPRDVSIRDIGAGLSRCCRYNGQLVEECDFLSVSEHSVLMTQWAIENGLIVMREDALALLLHDASEAYFGDMATPLKELMPAFRAYEDRSQAVIIEAFGLSPKNVDIQKIQIKLIDRRIRLDERDAAICEPARSAGKDLIWKEDPSLTELGVRIRGLNARQARQEFFEMFLHCVEHLPARDPGISQLLKRHADQARAHLGLMEKRKPDFDCPSM